MHSGFLSFIQSQELATIQDKVLLAVSGGLDSIVMTDLFQKSGFNITIAHCNFQLRGQESDEDSKFVESFSKKRGIRFLTKRFDTSEFADKRGISIQMAARELRYNWFHELMEHDGYDKLAIAHHKDDQLETILFNFSKGTGIAGLTGMQLKKRDNTIRPLLFTDRNAIEQYARSEELSWREDSSNESLKYHRNLIRHEVLPILKKVNPGLLDTLDYTLLRLTETESILNTALLTFLKEEVRKDGEDLYVSKASLQSSTFPTLALHALTGPFGFNYHQCVNIIESLDNTGNVFYSTGSVINIDRSEIILSTLTEGDFHSLVFEVTDSDEIVTLDRGSLKVIGVLSGNFEIDSSRDIAFLLLETGLFHWE
jgi:tRNA(Ile)-lysidine synthase